MGEPHKLKVNDQYEFELSDTDLTSLDIIQTGKRTFHFLKDNQSYHIELINGNLDGKYYQMKINNTDYDVTVETPLDALIDSMGFVLGNSALVSSIEAPMPGLILEVSVEEAQEVKEGDQLLILEAMKMENVITSPRDGIIKSITVKQGEAVEKKFTLITFE
ncbi:acetyl-CoA carboxylase biotin carboxyl carrier protein subunit [Croceitalea rosinachiae]|uniref:Acetyl-CoA carboxylase biotin carboxyl carrier protein subunit n=1 Tax=Croceitalea rosinachiae TaxID=3075596 RepID=A0ABU3AA08_9FLAO|nr:acetyl-CoA carboxylase biotin carboxyl carrier protein subunit [Croceitalea sp. F388]MDT0607013.1 acetyl-CoA carboxylase biotin carboxyl carrier protein subunit [Croceitalea sp. F388]